MTDSEKNEFSQMVTGILQLHGRPANATVLQIWWAALQAWSLGQVKLALESFVREGGNPIPASIVKLLPDQSGHPTPEEAWNAAQTDERTEGAYMTDQMLNAVCAAHDSIERGDFIAARRCFIDVYTQKVQEAKRERCPAAFRYFAPIALARAEKQQIEESATRDALVKGWITSQTAQGVLSKLDRPISDEMQQLAGKVIGKKRLK